MLVTWSKSAPEQAGRELSAIAADWGVSIEDAVNRLQPAGAIYWTMDEPDVQRVLSFPHTMIGSDGLPHDFHPHPRLWGTFPRVLGHYCRDLGLFGLEEAVRKMTGLPAARFGLSGRGAVTVGGYADITVFDPVTVIDRATFENPTMAAAGIEHVFVNGSPGVGRRPIQRRTTGEGVTPPADAGRGGLTAGSCCLTQVRVLIRARRHGGGRGAIGCPQAGTSG